MPASLPSLSPFLSRSPLPPSVFLRLSLFLVLSMLSALLTYVRSVDLPNYYPFLSDLWMRPPARYFLSDGAELTRIGLPRKALRPVFSWSSADTTRSLENNPRIPEIGCYPKPLRESKSTPPRIFCLSSASTRKQNKHRAVSDRYQMDSFIADDKESVV